MPRAIWNGTLGFGLVSVPVGLYSAVESKDIHFHQFSKSGQRIRNKRVAEKSGREVDYDDIVKGYELSKGNYVMITPDELEAADPKQTRTIEIEDFVGLDEIDPLYFESSYYLGPREGAAKPYALLREAMARRDRVAIGRFVMRTKQYLAAIRPVDRVLMLHTLYFGDEIRDTAGLDLPTRSKPAAREMQMAEQLIDSLTVAWDPKRYEDTYRKEVLSVIRKKSKGATIVAEQPEERPANVVDLFDALQASLEGKRKPKRSSRKAAKKTGKRPRARRAS
jgi:DNA end-binding protein Ku